MNFSRHPFFKGLREQYITETEKSTETQVG